MSLFSTVDWGKPPLGDGEPRAAPFLGRGDVGRQTQAVKSGMSGAVRVEKIR